MAVGQGRYDSPMSRQSHKQLSMVIDEVAVRRLPDVPLPAGYVMRAYRVGDAPSWADTLQKGGFTEWTEDRVLEYLEDPERRAGSRIVDYNGAIVAATFASQTPPSPSRREGDACEARRGCPKSEGGVLDFVVTHPDHRGRGLAPATCTEVSRFLVARGCKAVSLSTDDWRLPAIHIYLSMGFKPSFPRTRETSENQNDMPDRWATVYQMLKEAGYDHS